MSHPITRARTSDRVRLALTDDGPAFVLSGTGKVVIEAGPGGRAALFTLVERMHRELVTACETEHRSELHQSPEPGCPACERDQADGTIPAPRRIPYAELAAQRASLDLPAPLPVLAGKAQAATDRPVSAPRA